MNIAVGENIKKLRNQKGITQERLAESIGVTPQAISRWESGNGYPAIEYLPELAGFFGTSVDELLGLKLSEREAKREEIYITISHIEDRGYNPSAIDLLREAHAEFPGDRRITLALARALCSEMWEEEPNQALLREAEKILRDLIRHADDYDFRFACVKELAILYKEAWKDPAGYEEAVKMLPSLDSCREVFLTDFFNGGLQKKEDVQESIVRLSRRTVNVLRDYVAFYLPNEAKDWDSKIEYLNCLIDFCKHLKAMVDEEIRAEIDSSIAALYRYKATYYVAQNKKEDTIDSLQSMLDHIEKVCSSPSSKGLPHNLAWYFKDYLDHERYDPVRQEKQFQELKHKIESLAV